MFSHILKKVFGTRNERLLRDYQKVVKRINALEPEIRALSDEALSAKTNEFKDRLAAGTSLDALLPEAFAVVRETAFRQLKMRHFDVQLIGGMVIHDGKIAEMRTGEGKTLMATLPAYLNALTGNGVHIVTVNDYLAKRDAAWMKPVYESLGMTVGVNLSEMPPEEKQQAYAADITFGTNNEFGFDYLRDNMVYSKTQCVQRGLHFCIIDEVDSILIDEARTPLIISGQAEQSSELYNKINKLIPQLQRQVMGEDEKEDEIPKARRGDYYLEEKNRQAYLTEQGHQHVEHLLIQHGLLTSGSSLYDVNNINLMHYVYAALRAHTLYQRDVHYVVKGDEIVIVDDHTGRLMAGRRWSEGLHQAVEAKEGVTVQLENQTLATITFQNYFRLYEKLSGMTGTADTEAFEFQKIYGLEVVVIPTNKPMIRDDRSDLVFMTPKPKFKAILEAVQACCQKQQPVLVGTASIENSEYLSNLFSEHRITHQVLNAKQHEREAKIIAEAGRPGAVTIATNMAGRGTDIVLGGNLTLEIEELEEPTENEIAALREDWARRHQQVLDAGGLHVLGSERHESRRIDNQLRGRAGRQGDPGSSQFYLSMEDNLLRIFAGERMMQIMRKLGIKDDVIQHPWITRAIENAQRRVEGLNFDIRKQLLEFDDVANDQRKVIYHQREQLLESAEIADAVEDIRTEAIGDLVSQFIPPESLPEQWDIQGLEKEIQQEFNLQLDIQGWLEADDSLHEETLHEKIYQTITEAYKEKIQAVPTESVRDMEKSIMLQVLDSHWKDHLAMMDHLRQSIHLRGYAQQNPTQEYKRECFELFTSMLKAVKYEFTATLSRVQLLEEGAPPEMQMPYPQQTLNFHHATLSGIPLEQAVAQGATEAVTEAITPDEGGAGDDQQAAQQPFVRGERKLGRNEPCHCGSGKKYKHCHGKL